MRLEIRSGREETRKIAVSMRLADFSDASLRTYPYKSVPIRISRGCGAEPPGCGKPRLTVLCRVSSKKSRLSHTQRILRCSTKARQRSAAITSERHVAAKGGEEPHLQKNALHPPRRPQSAESAPLHRQPGGHISLILRMTMPIQAMSRGCTGMIRPSGLSLVSSSW